MVDVDVVSEIVVVVKEHVIKEEVLVDMVCKQIKQVGSGIAVVVQDSLFQYEEKVKLVITLP